MHVSQENPQEANVNSPASLKTGQNALHPAAPSVCVPSHVPNVRHPAINLSQLSVKNFLVHLMYATDAQTAALAIS